MPIKSSTPLILITGGAGFIGSHTADALVEAGCRVRILDNLDPQVHGGSGVFPAHLPSQVDCLRGDVRQEDDLLKALKGVSAVFHLAALTGVGQSMYDIKHYSDVNVTGTACLIETITREKLPIRKIVLSSSRAVYGEGTHRCPSCGIIYPPARKWSDLQQGRFAVFCPNCSREMTPVPTIENRPLQPISIYGWTKKLQEELCQYASVTYGLPTVILRYFNVYGSRQSLVNPYTGVISIFFSRMLAGKTISIYEHGLPLRDFVHVRDIVQANVNALETELPGGTIINIGSGSPVHIEEVGKLLAEQTGSTVTFDDRGEFRRGDIHSCIADLTRARQLLAYEPEVTLQAGMQEFVSWARENNAEDRYEQAVAELKDRGLFEHPNARAGK